MSEGYCKLTTKPLLYGSPFHGVLKDYSKFASEIFVSFMQLKSHLSPFSSLTTAKMFTGQPNHARIKIKPRTSFVRGWSLQYAILQSVWQTYCHLVSKCASTRLWTSVEPRRKRHTILHTVIVEDVYPIIPAVLPDFLERPLAHIWVNHESGVSSFGHRQTAPS